MIMMTDSKQAMLQQKARYSYTAYVMYVINVQQQGSDPCLSILQLCIPLQQRTYTPPPPSYITDMYLVYPLPGYVI